MAALIVSQVINFLCSTIIPCEASYEPPVSLLPLDFQPKPSFRQIKFGISNTDNTENETPSFLQLPIVASDTGVVEGYFMKVVSGREIFAFEGIPYAEPPIGPLRFKAPIPKTPWNDTFSAKSPGPVCLQTRFPFPQVIGNEDCLHLQIYTPKLPSKDNDTKLPVMIFIHGGSHTYSSGSSYGPSFLLEQDIVLANFNYRLGVLGLLSSGDSEGPGNYAFKDQALAIEWIVRNIHAFGGDSTKVTLSGQSSGAISTHFHMMSRFNTKNLFHRAMLFSGSAFSFWSLESLEESQTRAKKFAALSFCPTDSGSKQMMECLRTRRGDLLVANQIYMVPPGVLPLPPFPFLPSIEPDLPGAFLTEGPEDLYASGNVSKIPLVCTITSKELEVIVIVLEVIRAMPFLRMNFYSLAPDLLGYRNKVKNETEVSLKLLEYYGKGKSIDDVSRDFFSDVATDRYFILGLMKTIQLHSHLAPVYAAEFAYRSDLSYAATLRQNPYEFEVSHTEDMYYLFNRSSNKPIGRFDEKFAITKLLVNLYSNFVTMGQPVFTYDDYKDYEIWQPTKYAESQKFLKIDTETKMITENFQNRVQFWESLRIRNTVHKGDITNLI